MNYILVLLGVVLFATGMVRLVNEKPKAPDQPPKPEHGDRRIVQDGQFIQIEEYVKYPGWMYKQYYNSIEEAKKAYAIWDEIRNHKEKQIIEP